MNRLVSAAPPAVLDGDLPLRHAGRLASGFALASFLAVGLGCIVAGSAGVASGVWARNAAVWVIGVLLAQLAARIRPALLFRAVLLVTPLALLISLFSSGRSGVHRWISLGPLNWNVAFLLLPAAAVAFAATAGSGPRWTWWAAMVMQLELCLQPDASQATAFAAAVIVALLTMHFPHRARTAVSLFFLLAALVAWTRHDPLTPVPEVEGIVKLAWAVSGWMAALCVASLAAVAVSPLLARKFAPAVALSVYFLGCISMPLFGAFPVPLVGMGMSPIVGFWFGIGALTALTRTPPCTSVSSVTPW